MGRSNLGQYLTFHRDYPAAHEALRRCLEINPESSFGRHHVAILWLLEGNAAEALATARKIGIDAFRLTDAATAEHSLGNAEESQQALDELIANMLRTAPIRSPRHLRGAASRTKLGVPNSGTSVRSWHSVYPPQRSPWRKPGVRKVCQALAEKLS